MGSEVTNEWDEVIELRKQAAIDAMSDISDEEEVVEEVLEDAFSQVGKLVFYGCYIVANLETGSEKYGTIRSFATSYVEAVGEAYLHLQDQFDGDKWVIRGLMMDKDQVMILS